MKIFALIVLALGVLAAAMIALFLDIISAGGGHEGQIRGEKTAFAASRYSREEYIAHLLRTERHDDPELWRRIEAVKRLEPWPR
jgi:hypothetical protein